MLGDEALALLREFVADVMAAHGNDYEEASDTIGRDWPDLAVTFRAAYALIERAD